MNDNTAAACWNCNAAKKIGPRDFACRARPPLPTMIGTRAAALDMNGKPANIQPVINNYYPVVGALDWCREWQRNPDAVELEN